MSKSILFYWSKGAKVRVKLLNEIDKCSKKNEPCYLAVLAEKLNLSHVGAKKHLDLLVKEGFVRELNPQGKPIYVELSDTGKEVLKEFKRK